LQEQTFGALQNQYFPRGHRSEASPGQAAFFTIGVAFRISARKLEAPVWVCASADKAAMPSRSAAALNVIASFRIGDPLVRVSDDVSTSFTGAATTLRVDGSNYNNGRAGRKLLDVSNSEQ
jgi:hypothetical protein